MSRNYLAPWKHCLQCVCHHDVVAVVPGMGLPKSRFGKAVREVLLEHGGGARTTVGYGSVAVPGISMYFGGVCAA